MPYCSFSVWNVHACDAVLHMSMSTHMVVPHSPRPPTVCSASTVSPHARPVSHHFFCLKLAVFIHTFFPAILNSPAAEQSPPCITSKLGSVESFITLNCDEFETNLYGNIAKWNLYCANTDVVIKWWLSWLSYMVVGVWQFKCPV